MKKLLLTCVCLSIIPLSNAFATEQKDCSIEFKLNSSVALQNKNELDTCLDQLGQNNVEAVTIVGSASQSGSLRHNKKLAQERGLTVSRIIKAKYPNASIKQINAGVNEDIGKKTQIHFIITNENEVQQQAKAQSQIDLLQQKVTELEVQSQQKDQQIASIENVATDSSKSKQAKDVEEKENESLFGKNPNLRAAARVGYDSTRVNSRRTYLSGGGEISWLMRDNNFRPEIGVKASTSIDGVKIGSDQVARVTNTYGFIGVGATALGLVGGVRVLVGGEWINIASDIPQQDQATVGGEGRLGYEWKQGPSVFVSYALTEHLQMIGLDLGVSL